MKFFGNKQYTKSPVNQSYIWLAEFYDDTYLSEFDFKTKKPNNFYYIDKSKIVKFGLIGQGSQIYFDVGNGIFMINNHRIMVTYKANGQEYPLTGRTMIYNDIITYKDAIADTNQFLTGKGKFTDKIVQYNVGYKKIMTLLDVNINFQCIFSAPINQSSYMQFKITSDKDLDGELIIRRNGKVVGVIEAPLKSGFSGQCDWIIK